MNKSIAVVGIIVALVVIGGVAFYTSQNPALPTGNTTSTPTVSTNTDQANTTPVQTQEQAGMPIVTTHASVAPTDTTAVVTGVVTPNGAFTSYWYEYGTSDLGTKIPSPRQTIGSGFVSIPAPGYITGLVKDTTYYFRLIAENQYGKIAGVQYSFQTSHGNPPPVGSIPTTKTLAASGISRGAANLNGEVTPNRASTQYWFEYGKTTNLGNITGFVSVGDGTAKISALASLSDLNPLTTYYFRLNAQNQFGTVIGAVLNFRTAGPPSSATPSATTKKATDVSTSTVTLRGAVNPNGAETTYWFEYSTDSLFGSVLLRSTERKSAGANTNTMSVEAGVSGLSMETNYYFRLVAQNNLGIVRGENMTFKTR